MGNNMETIWEAKSEDVIKEMLRLKEEYGIKDFRAIELYGGDRSEEHTSELQSPA